MLISGTDCPPKVIHELAKMVKSHWNQGMILLVPRKIIGRTLLDALARLTGGWFHLRVVTLGDLILEALEIGNPSLKPVRMELIPGYWGWAYHSIEKHYFPEKPPQGLVEAVSSALVEALRYGIEPEDLESSLIQPPEKRSDLASMLRRYRELVSHDGWTDHATLIRRATETSKPSPYWLLVAPDVEFSPLEKEFLEARFPNQICLRDDELFDFASPSEEPNRRIQIEVFHAIDENVEVREIFRRILSEDMPLDDIEVALGDEAYASRIADVAESLENVPVTYSRGLSAVHTAPVRALLGFADWISNNYVERDLRRLVASGDLSLPEGLSPFRAARLLREAGIGWGRERYVPCLEALGAAHERRAQEAVETEHQKHTELSEQARELARWCETLLEVIPSGKAELPAYYKAAGEFLKRVTIRNEEDEGARTVLLRRLILPDKYSVSMDVGQAAKKLRRVAETIRVGASPPKPGALHVCGLCEAGLSGRRWIFIPGLDEARMTGNEEGNPIFRETDRQAVGLPPGKAKERLQEVVQAIARARGRIILSYPCLDLKKNQPCSPSSVILAAVRFTQKDQILSYGDISKVLGPPARYVPRRAALNDREWWYRELEHGGIFADGRDAVLKAYPDLSHGEEARNALGSAQLSVYHGHLEPSPDFDPRRNGKILSASQIQTYARCPRRYFLEYVLEIPVLEEIERNPWEWLDAASRGSLLHEFYTRFFEGRSGKVDPEGDKKSALELLSEIVTTYRQQIPVPSEDVFEREKRSIERDVRAFLHFAAEFGTYPEYREASFGLGNRKGALSPDPVSIPAGAGHIRLRGQIDRIDRGDNDHQFHVWDYKTGSSDKYRGSVEIAGGTQLQHALYAAAAEELLTAKLEHPVEVTETGYLFPTERGKGEVVRHQRDMWRRALEVLPFLCDAMAGGLFIPRGKDCHWCPFERVCKDMPVDWDQLRKIDEEVVRKFREVEAHV